MLKFQILNKNAEPVDHNSNRTEWEDDERKDLIYEYETKIAKAKRNDDTEAQYYYQDKLDELLREDVLNYSLINKKEEL